jgi:Rrf2 family protein
VKVGQKLEYACRVMIQLGRHAQDGQVSRVEDLANKESVSSNFLVQILNELRRAGLVSSRRGKMGGYALAKAPNEITLADMVKAIEGDVLSIDSDKKGESGERVVTIWEQVAKDIEARMAAVTLGEMMSSGDSLEYYI